MNHWQTQPETTLRPMRWLIALMVLVVNIFANDISTAEEVLIVLSSESKPFLVAAEECEKTLQSFGYETNRVLLASCDIQSIQVQSAPVIAVGSPAAAMLSENLPEQTALIYCMTTQPAELGLTKRVRSSGISVESDYRSQIQLLNDSGLKVSRVGYLYRSSNRSSTKKMMDLKNVIKSDWQLIAVDLDEFSSSSQGIKEMFKLGVDLVWTAADPSAYDAQMIKALLLESLRNKVPVYGFSHGLVRAGAALGIGINPKTQGNIAAKMLKNNEFGTHNQASFDIALNLIVAKRIRIDFAKGLVRRADQVIKSD
jgi:ABC-type uncharacterized transport system substrate-binding protein